MLGGGWRRTDEADHVSVDGLYVKRAGSPGQGEPSIWTPVDGFVTRGTNCSPVGIRKI